MWWVGGVGCLLMSCLRFLMPLLCLLSSVRRCSLAGKVAQKELPTVLLVLKTLKSGGMKQSDCGLKLNGYFQLKYDDSIILEEKINALEEFLMLLQDIIASAKRQNSKCRLYDMI